MSGDVGAEVAAVLAAHWEIDVENGGDQTEFFCDGCKATLLVGTGDADAAHLAHVADALAPLIAVRVEAAKAEALLEAADCANGPLGLSRDSNVGGDWLDGACDVIDWLRVRANDTQGRAVTGDVWAYGPDPSPEWIDFCVRAAKAEAWDEGHRAPKRYGPDDCKCGAYNESECGCGEYGSNVITPNPYRAADHDPEVAP